MNVNSFVTEKVINQSQRFVIYKAKRRSDDELVLIKTLAAETSADNILAKSLKSEAEAAIKLNHPAMRKGFSFLGEESTPAFVSEYISGMSLAEYLLQNDGRAKLEQSLNWARDILHALIYAEEQGYHHSNLNPYNIIIDEGGKLYLIGFGKEREAWRHSEGNPRYHFPLLYVAPETYKGSIIKANSDVYSWAVILYQALCGHLPWRLDSFSSPEENKGQSLTRGVILPDSDKVPDWLYSVLLACLKNDPDDRVESNLALLELLKMESIDFDWDIVPFEEPEEEEAEAVMEESEEPEEEEILPVEAEEVPSEPDLEEEEEPEIEEAPEPAYDPETPIHEPYQEPPAIDEEEIDTLALDETVPEITEDPVSFTIMDEVTDAEEIEEIEDIIDLVEEEIIPEEEIYEEPESSAVEPFEEPQQETFEPEEPEETAPAPETPVYTVPSADEAEYKSKDLGNMRKIFLILLAVSVVLVAILGIQKYLENRETRQGEIYDPEPDIEVVVEQTIKNQELSMVTVRADTLVMGSISPEANDDEFPLLVLEVPSFMIMPTELTQKQWMMVNKENPSLFKGDNLPVENVSFFDAIEYCNAKSELDGFTPAYDYHGSEIVCNFDADGYRLPTEAEWELAAKGGEGKESKSYSGSEDALRAGWFAENSDGGSHRVREKAANELGLYDMSGNVAEWVWNWYSPYSTGFIDTFAGPHEGRDRVIRGGSWYHGGNMMRVSARSFAKPYIRRSYIGFRLVRSIR